MIRKKSKLSIIFSFFLISSIALGEIAHDHSKEILDSDKIHYQILSLIDEYREKFNLQNDTGVDVLEKVMLQGGSKVERSVSVSLEASELFKEKKYIEAADLFVVAAQIDETEYTFYENAGIAYNLAGDYEKATINFDKVIYELNQRNGKAEFYKGVMLIKLESISKGCDYLKKAVEFGYSGRGSVDVYNNYCN